MIPRQIIEQVQAASDIVEVVSSFIPLKRAGRSFKACCPFHNEKTPSFFVNPEKQIWHCFGCGAGGAVFNFVMQYERVTFPEAVRILARKAGVAVPETRGEEGGRAERARDDLRRLNEFAAAWFQSQLASTAAGKAALRALRGRGIGEELVRHFSLGHAPDARDALIRAARAKRHREEALLELGLAVRGEGGGRPYDRFRGRIMIPIRDVSGRVIAFSGRVTGDGTPKYMNSPESVLFSKSRSLYGLHESKRAVVEAGSCIVVEGYFDLFALHAAGIRNVVASQGTAFTQEHARILRRYAPEIVVSFDADAAGEGAALRSLDALLHEGLRVRVLALPAGHDPDSFVREKGGDAFRALAGRAPDYFDHLLAHLCRRHDLRTEVGRARAAGEFLDALARVKDEILREGYRKKLAETIDIPQEVIIREIRKRGQAPPRAAERGGQPAEPAAPVMPAVEREIVRLLLEDDEVVGSIFPALAPDDFRDETLRRIVGTAFSLYREKRWAGCGRLMACLEDERCARVASALLADGGARGDRATIIGDCIRQLRRRALRDEIGRLTREIHRREREGAAGGDIARLQRALMAKKGELLGIS
ncbi:MAG: DNA primase [bacterium]|nr:DNA primase [bacterium]